MEKIVCDLPTNFSIYLDTKYRIYYCEKYLDLEFSDEESAIQEVDKIEKLYQKMTLAYNSFQIEKELNEQKSLDLIIEEELSKDEKYQKLLLKEKSASKDKKFVSLATCRSELKKIEYNKRRILYSKIENQASEFYTFINQMSDKDYSSSIVLLNSVFHTLSVLQSFTDDLNFLLKNVSKKSKFDITDTILRLNFELKKQLSIFSTIDNQNYKDKFNLFTKEIESIIKEKTEERLKK